MYMLYRLELRLYVTVDCSMNESWGAYLASPADFVGADDIITNLAKSLRLNYSRTSIKRPPWGL